MATKFLNIPLEQIRLNPVALRAVNRDSVDFLNLTESIKSEGVLSSVSVRENPQDGPEAVTIDGKPYTLIDGLQRFTASGEANLETIPAQVLDRDEAGALITQIIANAHKIETKPIEYCHAIMKILSTNPTMTEADVCGLLKISPSWLATNMGLNRLIDAIKPLVNESKIAIGNAFMLAKLPPEEQLEWVDRAQTEGTSQFVPAVQARIKAIKDAARQGKEAGPATFTPVMHLRKLPEIKSELDNPTIAAELIRETQLLNDIKGVKAAAEAGFALGLKWATNFDPISVKAQEARDTERKAKSKAESEARAAERKVTKDKEAAAEAAKIREQAAALDPDVLAPVPGRKAPELQPA